MAKLRQGLSTGCPLCPDTAEIPRRYLTMVGHGTKMGAMPDHGLLTTAETAALLGKSVRTIARLAGNGALPYEHKTPGKRGQYLFRRKVIERIAGTNGKASS